MSLPARRGRRAAFPDVPEKTCSILVRLSKLANDENTSKEGMVKECTDLAERLGLTIHEIYIDDGVSGAVRNRDGFTRWLSDARECRVDTLVSWHVDRMTREGLNVAALILDTIEGKDPVTGQQVRHAVRLVDTKGLDSAGDETAFRFSFVIKAEIARAERERIKDRNFSTRQRLKASNRWPGGTVPYGFQVVDNPDPEKGGKVLVKNPEEAAFLEEAAQRLLAGMPPADAPPGWKPPSESTLLRVTQWANGPDGRPPRRAKVWQRESLRTVLTGFAVRGLISTVVDGERVPAVDADGNLLRIPAILDEDTAAALRAMFAQRSVYRGGRKPSRLLSGVLRCGTCTAAMHVVRESNRPTKYRCSSLTVSQRCDQVMSINAEPVEDHVTAYFLKRWGTSPQYVKRARVVGAAEVESAQLAVAFALNTIAQSATSENLVTLQQAQERLKEAQAQPQFTEVTIAATGKTIAEAWATAGLDERRDLISTNIAEIFVKDGKHYNRFNPDRLLIVDQPPHALGEQDDQWRPGSVAV